MSSLATQTATELVFVDSAIADSEQLSQYMRPGVEIVLLDANQDGIQQISDTLAGHSGLESVHILSHGAADTLYLGSTELNLVSIEAMAGEIAQWSSAFSEAADLLLYGCDVAADGMALIERLSQLTGTDVAASTDLTGSAGDWDLEAVTGKIEAAIAVNPAEISAYSGTFNIITVTSAANSGAGTLRDAIARASGGTVIRFAPGLANRTITLASELVVDAGKNLVIDGAAAANLTISGNRQTRIFQVNSNQDRPTRLTLRNLTLADGFTSGQGGAIKGEHKASVLVEDVTFFRNVANEGGGAIFSAWENNLTVRRSTFQANRATASNDERGAGAIAFVSPGLLTIDRSNFIGNLGINGGAVNSLNAKLTITNSRFANNNTLAARFATGQPRDFLRGFGGALYVDRASSTNEPSGYVRISGTRFENNQGQREGGAAYIYTGGQDSVSISTTLFRNNSVKVLEGESSGGNGGALVLMSNDVNRGLLLDRTSFVGNVATGQGGGLWMMNAPTTVINSTFSSNRVLGDSFSSLGGAMALRGNANIINSTIAFNSAGWVGGGILASSDHTITAKNTIFYRNAANNGGNDWNIQQHTNRALTNLGGNIQTGQANDDESVTNVRVVDAKLAALSTNGHPYLLSHGLQAGSPAINTGVSSGTPNLDQSGTRRDSRVDAGAEEFVGNTRQVNVVEGDNAPNRLVGSTGVDLLMGYGGNDLLIGRQRQDVMVGGDGSDHFIFAANSVRAAFRHSVVTAPDRIKDFSMNARDRIRLDFDNDLSTTNRPRRLFNAGRVRGTSRANAARAAFVDKNQAAQGNQRLQRFEAVMFEWRDRSFIAVNDNGIGFSTRFDLVVDVTGIQRPAAHLSAGVLPTANYFV